MFSIKRKLLMFAVYILVLAPQIAQNHNFYVSGFFGEYDLKTKNIGHYALSLRGSRNEGWKHQLQAGLLYRIGSAISHLNDSFWLEAVFDWRAAALPEC